LLASGGDELVTVEIGSAQRHEQCIRRQAAAIGADRRKNPIDARRHFSLQQSGGFAQAQGRKGITHLCGFHLTG
jgi:hypothetical protein